MQDPHIPMMIAGGEQVTPRLVARYGDLCNVIESPEGLRHKYSVLARHCADVGRGYDGVRRTTTSVCIMADTDEEARATVPPGSAMIYPGDLGSYGLIGTLDTIRERIAAYEAAGVQEIAIGFEKVLDDPDVPRRFAAEFIG